MKSTETFYLKLFGHLISILRFFYFYSPIPRNLKLKLKTLAFRIFGNNFIITVKRNSLSKKYIHGTGLEIGPLHFPLRVGNSARVKYIDLFSKGRNEKNYPELRGQAIVDPDIIDDGERLEKIPEGTQEFIIANHFLEHCINPIGTIRVHLSKLRTEGILYYAIPNKDFTFDVDRPLTTFQHLIDEDTVGPEPTESNHYEEWVQLVEKVSDQEEIKKNAENLKNLKVRIHFHCWNMATLRDFFSRTKDYLGNTFEIEKFGKNLGEVLVILRKK